MIAAIILAAGLSRRMGRDKLSLPVDGAPMYCRAIRLVEALPVQRRLIVTNQPAIQREAKSMGLNVMENPKAKEGMGTTVACAVSSLPADTEFAVFLTCDQPYLTASAVASLIDRAMETNKIIVPMVGGKPGSPCVFPQRFFAELSSLSGDCGGKAVYKQHIDEVVFLPVACPAAFADVDTPEDYDELIAQPPG